MTSKQITITRPDDWHLHLRDGDVLETTVFHAAKQFGRAIIMPNLRPPVTDIKKALEYRSRILQVRDRVAPQSSFEPLMTLYLTDRVTPTIIQEAAQQGLLACKLYPAGATTNSDAGVSSIEKIYPALEAMQKHGMVLLLHGEVTDQQVDLFDREAVFIDQKLIPLRRDFPQLKMVLEHITTQDAVQYVQSTDDYLAATITAHHLLFNRNAIFLGGVRPHYYCLPVLKRETHRQALVKAATSGNPRFFLGTDSAPHATVYKETSTGCAGCYTAATAIELYAHAFDAVNALDRLEVFASFNGADFYNIPRNHAQIVLQHKSWTIPESYSFGAGSLKPLCAGETLDWQCRPA